MADVPYNPFDPRDVDRNDELLPRLREREPITELSPGVFFVTTHADATAVMRDFETYQQGGFQVVDEEEDEAAGGRRVRRQPERQLGETNPPEHTPVRRLLAGEVGPERLKALEPTIVRIANELLDGFEDRGRADLAAAYAAPVPAFVIAAWAGIPADFAGRMQGYADDVVLLRSEVDDPAEHERAQERVDAFDAEILELIASRRAAEDPGTDLLGALLADGEALDDRRAMTTLTKDVIMGGTETTRHLIADAFFQILRVPGTWERLAADRSLVPRAVEETMRISSPVQVVLRQAAGDQELHGTKVPADSTVVVSLAGANRDPAAFPDPDRFDPGRNARTHVGYGHGLHRCVGARLASLEATIALGAALERFATMRLADGSAYERVNWWMMNAPRRLDVEFEPR